jgi:hypothetical protein
MRQKVSVSQTEFAKVLGVSRQRVSALVKQGLPANPDGLIPREAGLKWVRSNVLPKGPGAPSSTGKLTDVRVQRELVRLGRDKLQLALQEGTVVRVTEVDARITKMILTVRGRLLRVGHAVGPTVAIETDGVRCTAVIDGAIRDALTESADELSRAQASGKAARR